jgi:chromosome segregation protein
MRLKKLTIIGFKSFADKVSLDFDCSIVGIVGPNGCGKSNIVDAVRWVMGEQSAKSLRGEKMHDILFAGNDQRKPINFAEVSVTLTDIDGELPLPYVELTLTRRLHRSGESEYLINREPVRLRDVQSLFLGSGLGKNAFSIFEQGKLDQIIHLNPVERRVIFDEAAGTSRFLLRKKETVRKLATMMENYNRAKDLHAEIEKQTKQLKKQASQAQNYQANIQRLSDLEKGILITRWRKIHEKNEQIAEKLEGLKSAIHKEGEEGAKREEQLAHLKQELASQEGRVKALHKERNSLDTKIHVEKAELSQQKHHLLEIKKREERVKAHLKELKGELLTCSQALRKAESQLTNFSIENDLKNQIKLKREEHLKKIKEEGRLIAELKEKTLRYEARLARLNTIQTLECTHEKSLAENEKLNLERQAKMQALGDQIDVFKKEFQEIEQELVQLRKKVQELQKEEHTLIRQMTEMEGQQKALQRLKDEMEGFSIGAKELLKEAKNKKSVLFNKVEPLFEYLLPKKGYESLLASSLKIYADTLVVANENDFKLLLAFAKEKKITDFSVIIRSKLAPSSQDYEPNKLVSYLAENPIAYHFTHQIEVVAEDQFYDGMQVFFTLADGKKTNNTFYRQAELKSLSEALEHLKNQVTEQGVLKEEGSKQLQLLEKKRSELGEKRRKKEMDLVQENFHLQQGIKDFEKLKKEAASLKKEKESLENIQADSENIETLKATIQALKNEGLILLSELKKEESLYESVQELTQQIAILQTRQEQGSLQEGKLLQETEELHTRIESAIQKIAQHEREVELSQASFLKIQMDLKEQESTLYELKKRYEIQEKEILHWRKLASQLEKEAHALDVVLARDLSEREGIEQELLERHGLSAENILTCQGALTVSMEEAIRETHQLKSALESAGAVNLAAIEEFQEAQMRFDHYDQQLKDLSDAKNDLEEIIAKLDQESRKTFKKTFQQIRANFQKNFELLFNGGTADLTFTESVDILEAGIEIVAKPPGKQLRAISLLSGGEKCLTALALLFSIFEVKPAPFCILDEVDAPLDDSNIDRFTRVLTQFIEKTQFLIVTHNKKTMSIADLLIGVSMEEKGVSKLISLAFEKKSQSQVTKC